MNYESKDIIELFFFFLRYFWCISNCRWNNVGDY